MQFKYSKSFSAYFIIIIIVLGLSLFDCNRVSNSDADTADGSQNVNEKLNPIDEWHLKMEEQYGNSHTDGWISYIYGEAWKAELHHLIKEYNNTETANSYYNAVVQEANSINKLLTEQEEKVGWGTGSPGRVELSSAIIYKNGVYQLDPYYSDFIFDADAATKEYLDGN